MMMFVVLNDLSLLGRTVNYLEMGSVI